MSKKARVILRFFLVGALVGIWAGCSTPMSWRKIEGSLRPSPTVVLDRTEVEPKEPLEIATDEIQPSQGQSASIIPQEPPHSTPSAAQEWVKSTESEEKIVASLDPQLLSALEHWPPPEKAISPLQQPAPIEGFPRLDIEDHPRVEAFVVQYQKGNDGDIRRWLGRSTRYLPMIKEILRGEGIPEDLAYLPMIESGFDPRACSRRNAVGLWQLMRGTARKYGLRIDWWVDERRDPVKSTRAAARYLKDLYGMFGSWDLAIAAYNAGEGRIRRGVRRRKVERFWDLCRHRDIKRETKNFVPKFMAAVKIARDPEGYGFREIPYEEPWRFDLVKASEPLDLQTIARLVGTDQKEIRAFNPQLKRWCTPPGPPEVDLRVPEGTAQRFLEGLGELSLGERIHVRVHRVRPGETLSKIASRYGSRVDLIAKMNRLRSIHRIRAESQLLVPTPRRPVKEGSRVTSRGGSPGQRLKPKGGATRVPGQEEAIVHRVKRGETLWAISRRYGVQVSDIRRWNNLRGHHIRPGDELIVMKKES